MVLCVVAFLYLPKQPKVIRADFENSIGMKFVKIPAGEFLMGAPDWDKVAEDDERPAHPVKISKPFYLGVFEVTQSDYKKVTGDNPSYFSPIGRGKDAVEGYDSSMLPVEMVSWYDAQKFCEKLSAMPKEKTAGRSYRLPTEAEWEYACRAGTTTRFIFGNKADLTKANYLGSHKHTMPVDHYEPNAFGLYSMHGNVLEWCQDWHHDDYYKISPVEDPKGPDEQPEDVRVLRGGGVFFKAASSSFRDDISPYRKGESHGFRVVVDINETGESE